MAADAFPMLAAWAGVLLALGALPFILRWFLRRTRLRGLDPDAVRVVSQVAVGPQQRVVVVEVGKPQAAVQLVLGVTPQSVQCLHRMAVDVPSEGNANV